MPYSREQFKGGSLKQYPELWEMLRNALYELPYGQEVIEIIVNEPGYQHLRS